MTPEASKAIRKFLLEGIETGKLTPGTRLPTVPELCRDFGASRHSVRRAILALAVEGRLSVEQGDGVAEYSRAQVMMLARCAESEWALVLDQHPDLPVMVVTKIDVDPRGGPVEFSEAIWSAHKVKFADGAACDDRGHSGCWT
ncbi:MAG: DNA-binding GntR family transcriptional regulator [Dinoroseobacter sp.]|jgi:DNA-binding GntR family transcriptional regulator